MGAIRAGILVSVLACGCGDDAAGFDGPSIDAPVRDAPQQDRPALDAEPPDAPIPDAPVPDACSNPDADLGTPGCVCARNGQTSGVCGTGTVSDPFRCCNAAEDGCSRGGVTAAYDPCRPMRCSIEPDCCIFYFESCRSDADCGGRAGSCDLSSNLCVSPCDPTVNGACGGATRTCQPYGGASYRVPDNTPCDDGRICTTASPRPSLVDCTGTDGLVSGPDCTRDRPPFSVLSTDCPASAPVCSGTGSVLAGNGGAIVGGRCCPDGTACDLDPTSSTYRKCLGDFGKGAHSNDVCRAGVCSHDDSSACCP
jgi:hypothetical protein